MAHRTNVLPFPVEREVAPAPSGPLGVQINPMVGYNAIELTYFDTEHIPRIRIQLDTTVPPEIVQRARRWMELTGADLRPFPSAGDAPLLGPRLLP